MKIRHPMTLRHPVFAKVSSTVQPIADRVAQNLESISQTFSTNQISAHGICDEYHVISGQIDKSREYPGTKLKVFRNSLKTLCRPLL